MTAPGAGVMDCCLNLFHWLFACEYWHAARKIPDGTSRSDKTVKIVKWVGAVVNILPFLPFTYFEWVLEESILDQDQFGTPLPTW